MPKLDNPGGGNCGYYAIAIGLIDAIQQEQKKESTRTLDSLNRFLEEPIEQKEFLEFDLNEYHLNMDYKRSFLDHLQTILRNVAVIGFKKELSQQALRENQGLQSQIDGTSIFGKFMQLVESKLNGVKLSSEYNEMVLSGPVNQLAQQVLNNLTYNGKIITIAEYQGLSERIKNEVLTSSAKTIFKQDVFQDNLQFSVNSHILKATNRILQSGVWATHSDLQSIASELNVNLNINTQFNGANLDDRATIVLNNSHNVHWTTVVDSLTTQPAKVASTKIDKSLMQKVLMATISSVEPGVAQENFKMFVELLLQRKDDLKVNAEDQIKPENLDHAKAKANETDEQFAERLQEAEFRRVGLKK
jgi:hypothetical protein